VVRDSRSVHLIARLCVDAKSLPRGWSTVVPVEIVPALPAKVDPAYDLDARGASHAETALASARAEKLNNFWKAIVNVLRKVYRMYIVYGLVYVYVYI